MIEELSRPWENPSEPGRFDINGVEWWACDPHPHWYRWEQRGDKRSLVVRGLDWTAAPWVAD